MCQFLWFTLCPNTVDWYININKFIYYTIVKLGNSKLQIYKFYMEIYEEMCLFRMNSEMWHFDFLPLYNNTLQNK